MARATVPTTTRGWHTIADVERILRSRIPNSDGPITLGTGNDNAMTLEDAIAIMNTQEDNVFLELAFAPTAANRGALFVEMLARFSAYRIWCDAAQYDEIPGTVQGWYDYSLFIQKEFSEGRYNIGDQTTAGSGVKTIMTRDEFDEMTDANDRAGGQVIVDTERLH